MANYIPDVPPSNTASFSHPWNSYLTSHFSIHIHTSYGQCTSSNKKKWLTAAVKSCKDMICVFLMIYRHRRRWRHCDHWCWDQICLWSALCSGLKQGFSLRVGHWPSGSGAQLSDQLPVRSLPWTVSLSPALSLFLSFSGSSCLLDLDVFIPFLLFIWRFVYVPLACSDTWMSRLCSPGPPSLLSWLCWTTTTGWLGRLRTSLLSSWRSRKPLSGRPWPTLSWAESCLLSSTPRVNTSTCNIHVMQVL